MVYSSTCVYITHKSKSTCISLILTFEQTLLLVYGVLLPCTQPKLPNILLLHKLIIYTLSRQKQFVLFFLNRFLSVFKTYSSKSMCLSLILTFEQNLLLAWDPFHPPLFEFHVVLAYHIIVHILRCTIAIELPTRTTTVKVPLHIPQSRCSRFKV